MTWDLQVSLEKVTNCLRPSVDSLCCCGILAVVFVWRWCKHEWILSIVSNQSLQSDLTSPRQHGIFLHSAIDVFHLEKCENLRTSAIFSPCFLLLKCSYSYKCVFFISYTLYIINKWLEGVFLQVVQQAEAASSKLQQLLCCLVWWWLHMQMIY